MDVLGRAHLGLCLLSASFLGSDFIAEEELPRLVGGRGEGVEGKRLVPVAFGPLDFNTDNTRLGGLRHLKIFRDGEGCYYLQRRSPHRRDEWILQLSNHLHTMLKRHAVAAPTIPSAGSNRGGQGTDGTAKQPCKAWPRLAATQMFSPDSLLVTGEYVVGDIYASRATLREQALTPAEPTSAEKVVVMDYLLDWLADVTAPPLFALLGEYGMGKTVTCQRLMELIEQRHDAGEPLPEAYYFDLRRLTSLRERSVPDLATIIDECITHGWSLHAQARPTAADLLERATTHSLLFVFDGLDEALVHFTEGDGQRFTRQLLRLRETESAGTRILISCRTHFFRSLQEQTSHFTAYDRENTCSEDYRAIVLTPFTEDQVRTYFENALPEVDVDQALELIHSVHNLTELSQRPYSLRLIGEFIPELEQRRARGKPVYGVTSTGSWSSAGCAVTTASITCAPSTSSAAWHTWPLGCGARDSAPSRPTSSSPGFTSSWRASPTCVDATSASAPTSWKKTCALRPSWYASTLMTAVNFASLTPRCRSSSWPSTCSTLSSRGDARRGQCP